MLKNAAKDLLPEKKKKKSPKEKPTLEKAALKALMDAKLSPQEEYFCELYVSDIEFYGNGTQSYIEAFDITVVLGKSQGETDDNEMTHATVRANASKLLTDTNILNRIHELLEDGGFNDQHADKTLQFLMTQKADLRVALGAIDAYNKLMSRIQDRQHVLHSFANEDVSDDELQRRIAEKQKFFNKK